MDFGSYPYQRKLLRSLLEEELPAFVVARLETSNYFLTRAESCYIYLMIPTTPLPAISILAFKLPNYALSNETACIVEKFVD